MCSTLELKRVYNKMHLSIISNTYKLHLYKSQNVKFSDDSYGLKEYRVSQKKNTSKDF